MGSVQFRDGSPGKQMADLGLNPTIPTSLLYRLAPLPQQTSSSSKRHVRKQQKNNNKKKVVLSTDGMTFFFYYLKKILIT